MTSTTPESDLYTILFVDDEEKARKYFSLALEYDYHIKTAANVGDAMDILKEFGDEIAIVISDQRMPGGSGVDLLKMVKDYYPGIVRLLTTAYADLDDAIAAINRGEILRYIQKPWEIDSLKIELKQALNFYLLRAERDILLKEKLSARYGMVQLDRIRQIILFTDSLSGLRFTDHAVRQFVEQSVRHDGSDDSDITSTLDIWEMTFLETERMRDFIHRVKQSLAPRPNHGASEKSIADAAAGEIREASNQMAVTSLFAAVLNTEELLEEIRAAAERTGRSMTFGDDDSSRQYQSDINMDEYLFHRLFENVFFCFNGENESDKPVSVSWRPEEIRESPQSGGVSIRFEQPDSKQFRSNQLLSGKAEEKIEEYYVALLSVYLLCHHHGGYVDAGLGEAPFLELKLPLKPGSEELGTLSLDWLKSLLIKFETDLQ